MKGIKPIKRHTAIVALSKDHHFALLLVWKIREGLRKSIEPARISSYIVHFFETDLIPHFKEEEELLFSKLATNNELRIQAEEEHRHMKQLVDDLRKNPTDKDLVEKFAGILEGHIRFEERKLFNHLQENLPEDYLAEVASSLAARAHEQGIPWKDIFWSERKGLQN